MRSPRNREPSEPGCWTWNDRDRDGLAALLHDDLRVRLLHTGEEFDKAGYVRLIRDLVEVWTAEVSDPPDHRPALSQAARERVDTSARGCQDDDVTTGGESGFDRVPSGAQGAPSVTTLMPALARARLALAGVQARQVLGAALVLLWAAWLIALWVSQPRLVPPDLLEGDLAAGTVTQYAVVVLDEGASGPFDNSPAVEVWPAPEDAREQLSRAGLDVDDSTGSRVLTISYWVDSPVADQRLLNPDRFSPGDLAAIADRLDDAGIEDRTASSYFLVSGNGTGNTLALLMLVGLVIVVVGPRPGRGNRWCWFWLLGLPLGLGLLALAVFELLRPPRLVVVPEGDTDGDTTASEPGVVPRRLSGWGGFWISILGGILVTIVASELADRLPLFFVRA